MSRMGHILHGGKGTSASIGGIKVTREGGLGAGPLIRNKKFKEEQEI